MANTNYGNNSGPGGTPRPGAGLPGGGGNPQIQTTEDSVTLPMLGTNISVGTGIRTRVNVTQGYFSNGAGLLQGSNIHTGALAASNEKYYFNVTNTHPLSSSAENQFSVAFGHRGGSGSNVLAGNETPTLKGETEAIYKQFSSLLLPTHIVSGGFHISNQGSAGQLSAGTPDDFIYTLVANRERYKDKLDNKSWTIKLKGRDTAGVESGIISLTDDSVSNTQTGSFSGPAGPRYNIVSGAAGSVTTAASVRTFGHFYPQMGVMVFSGAELSSSIPGPSQGTSMTASFDAKGASATFRSASGFAPNLNDTANPKNALKLVNCLRNIGTNDIRLRSSQEQEKLSYYCTVMTDQCNFTTNGTFTSGSQGKMRHKSMYSNPNVYITGVGLHNAEGVLMAVAKLSTPILKNFGSQHTIKVNLTY